MEYEKICPYCKKSYKSSARNQKFCCPEHGKKYNERLKKNRRFQDSNKELYRIKARAHALAVEILKFHYHTNSLEWKCQRCSSEERLEVHHKNLDFLDNRLSNLELLCSKCHSKEHSDLLKSCGGDLSELYSSEFASFFKDILKRKSSTSL